MQPRRIARRPNGDRVFNDSALQMRSARDARMRLEGANAQKRDVRQAALFAVHHITRARQGSL